MSSLAPGTYLAERFQILHQLSRGDAKPIYLAADRSNQAALGSLKVLVALRELDLKDYNLGILSQEIKVLRGIQNENILKVFELIQGPQVAVVSVEHIEGEILADKIAEQVFTTENLLEFLIKIAKGLEALHNAGFIHGALSDETVFINAEGSPKIDPLACLGKSGLSAGVDIKDFGILGLELAAGKNYIPKSFALDRLQSFWNLETQHPESLLKLLSNLAGEAVEGEEAKAYRDIRLVRLQLEQLLSELRGREMSAGEFLTVVFNGNLAIFGFFLALLVIFFLLGFVSAVLSV